MAWTRTASSRATGTRAGRALRQATLIRDGHQCTHHEGGIRCTARADQADHVVPVHKGGASVLGNMASLCAPHHRVKTAAEAVAARLSERRPTAKHPGLL
jgi:5-methylcytosine-specific restriction endonuclease McrA